MTPMEPREGDLTMPMPPQRQVPPASQPQPATEPFSALPPVPYRQSPRSAAPGYWTPQGYYYAPPPQTPPRTQTARQAPRGATQQRMPKAQALALTQRLKRWLISGTLAAFVSLAALAAAHATGVTAQAGATSTGSGDNNAQPANNNDDGGGFFGTQPSFGSPGFGSGGGSQAPISGTGTS